MNKAVAPWPAVGLAVMLATALMPVAACHRDTPRAAPPLAGARIGGRFTLVDQDGRSFSSDRLRGRYAIVYFGYTYCPDVCPTEMQTLARGLRLLDTRAPAKAAKVQPLFITVDPARDTPAVLRAYVRAFDRRIVGLTGSEAQIAAVARDYAAFYRRQPPANGAGGGYLMQHSTVAMLFGPDGAPIALVPVDADAAQVADTLATWVA